MILPIIYIFNQAFKPLDDDPYCPVLLANERHVRFVMVGGPKGGLAATESGVDLAAGRGSPIPIDAAGGSRAAQPALTDC